MKINKAKMMVATLAIVAGAATVGSISGTVAWFQYNTRVTAAYVGTSASVSRNLQIRIVDEHVAGYEDAKSPWKVNLEVAEIQDYLDKKTTSVLTDAEKEGKTTEQQEALLAQIKKGNGKSFSPVTYGKHTRDTALPSTGDFVNGPKANPRAQQFAYSSWADSAAGDYVYLPLQVRYMENGAAKDGKKVYLTDLTLQKDSTESSSKDLSNALFVHFSSGVEQTWSKTNASFHTSAALDLDGDGLNDKIRSGERYEWSGTGSLAEGVYGDATVSGEPAVRSVDSSALLTSYMAGAKNDADSPMADDANPELNVTDAIALGTTNASGLLNINATIWLEGWALLDGANGITGSVDGKDARDALVPAIGAIYEVTHYKDDPSAEGEGETKYFQWNGTAWAEVSDPRTDSAVWDGKYAESKFNVGFTFAAQDKDIDD